ncbi:Os12g0249100 [Oryza sativa Japonica Group]|uniref:Os12g0249100 protein n=1 Tax=Oryza sativa subsp. japonica TaxID=39947 RepID=A0A0N7KTT8_ORYSJ|nr:Os12g0249100 [Oryza sativa Japonica Group]
MEEGRPPGRAPHRSHPAAAAATTARPPPEGRPPPAAHAWPRPCAASSQPPPGLRPPSPEWEEWGGGGEGKRPEEGEERGGGGGGRGENEKGEVEDEFDGRSRGGGDRIRTAGSARESLGSMAGVVTLVTSILLLLSGSTYGYGPKVCTGRGVFFSPTIALGLLLMAAFILGTCGQRYGDECLFGCYLLGLLIAFPLLLAFIIFGYVAVGGIDLGGVSIREYNLEEYSGWLRGRVADPHYWETTSACLRDGNVCSGMTRLVRDPDTGILAL